jgi:hypothetical protein
MEAASSCQHSALLSPRSGLIGPIDGVCETVAHRLCDADVGHRDLLEQVWGSDDRGRMTRQFCSELGMAECSPVVSGRFPDGIIEIRRAFAESAVKLGGDEARLALHESSVVLPAFYIVVSSFRVDWSCRWSL